MSGRRDEDSELQANRAQDHIDQKWLEAREKGLAELPPINKQRAEEYRALERALAELPEHQAPEGWDAALLAEARRLEAAAPFCAPLVAAAGSAEPGRVALAAPRTRTLIADGSHPGIVFEDAAVAPSEAELSSPPPTRTFAATRPRRGRLLAVAGLAAVAAGFCAWLLTRREPQVASLRVAEVNGLAAREPEAAPQSEQPIDVLDGAEAATTPAVGRLSTKILRGAPRSEVAASSSSPRGMRVERASRPAEGPSPSSMPTLAPASARRGEAEVFVGDTFTAELVVAGGRPGELRLYNKVGDVVARCSTGDSGCATSPERDLRSLRLSFLIKARGSYRVVYLEGEAIAAPTGDLNRDLALCSSCRTRLEAPILAE